MSIGDVRPRVPFTRVTVEVPSHIMKLGETFDTFRKELNGPMLIVRVYIHKMKWLIFNEESEQHDIAIVNEVFTIRWT